MSVTVVAADPISISSRCAVPATTTWNSAAVDTLGDSQPDTAGVGVDRAACSQRRSHADRRPHGALGVVLAVECEQQRVATVRQQIATLRERDLQEIGKAPVEDQGQFLGPRLAERRQVLGQFGEAGDVCEQDTSVELPGGSGRLDREHAWHVGGEDGGGCHRSHGTNRWTAYHGE